MTMKNEQRSLFLIEDLPQQCAAAECRELAAPGNPLCPTHRACRRNGLMGLCISCHRWMDDPEHWGYNCAECAYLQNSTVNKRLKARHGGYLYEKQQGKCPGCQCPIAIGKGTIPEDLPLDLDHIKPRRRGGRDNLENLQLLCQSCNRRKKDMPDADFMKTRPALRMDL